MVSPGTSNGLASPETLLTNPTNQGIKSYPRRWLILFISATGIFLRAFVQSCFGNINNVYVNYFRKAAWQIDWFVLTTSVTVMVMLLPMTIASKKLNVRATLCLTSGSSFLAYVINSVGVLTRDGYSSVLIGQIIEGASAIVSWSVLTLVAAVWFPSSEVAMAIAVQNVARGVGEAAGSIIPPYIVSMKSTPQQVKWQIFAMFASLSATSVLMFILSFMFASDPPTPPSEAEKNVQDLRKSEQSAHFGQQLKNYVTSMKTLFTSTTFLLLLFVFGAFSPILRTNNILLSSMLHKAFPEATNINRDAGMFLAIAWLLYIVGSFIAGPIIAKTRKYKEITCVSAFGVLFSSILLLIGVEYSNVYVIYTAVLVEGFSLGAFGTIRWEILIEVTYPENTLLVSMSTLVVVGCFRLIYPIVGRVLLEKVNATASNALPVATLLVGFVLLLLVKKDYRRSLANSEQEMERLVRPLQTSSDKCRGED